MMKKIKILTDSILAGICIGIGGTIYLLCENKVIGALLFTIGLFTICTFKLNLFTGKVCYIFDNDKKYMFNLLIIYFGNFIGTFITSYLLKNTRISSTLVQKSQAIINIKLNDSLLSIFILAIFCNILIYIGVEEFNKNEHELGKYLGLFFGIMVFILCGFEHCIANMFYFSMSGTWSINALLYLFVMTLGNSFGGILFPLLRKVK